MAIIDGDGGPNTLEGTEESDIISGFEGDDKLHGHGDDDILIGGPGKDKLYGGAGDDTLRIDAVADIEAGEVYDGGDGNDTLDDNSVSGAADLSGVIIRSIETLTGFGGGLSLTAKQLAGFTGSIATGAITLTAGGNADLSGAQVSTQTFNLAEAGNNLTLNDAGFQFYFVNGAGGNDKVTIVGGTFGAQVSGGGGDDVLTGGDAGDTLNGEDGDDLLKGGLGNDILTGGLCKDTLQGGDGDDDLRIIAADEIEAGEVYDGGDGNDTLNGNAVGAAADLSGVTIKAIETLTGFGGGVSLTAKQLAGFTGSIATGAITLTAGGNADLSATQVSTQFFNLAEAGNNLTLNDAGFQFYIVNGAGGNDKVTIAGGTFGSQVSGGGGDDVLTGGSAGDTLDGGEGDDLLKGGGGNDTLVGGLGKDTLQGGEDDDTLRIDAAAEIEAGEVYDGGDGSDSLSGTSIGSPVDLSDVTIKSIETITGFFGGVSLTAKQLAGFTGFIGTGAMTLTTGGKADLSAAQVSTQFFNLAEAGNNLTLNDAGVQIYTVNGAGGNDKVTIAGGVFGSQVSGGGGDDVLTGGGAGDTLNGEEGDDLLKGGLGNDVLIGGLGMDTLQGGEGDDTLRIDAVAEIESGEVYDGGDGDDTLNGTSIGSPVDLSDVTIKSIENLTGFFGGLSLTAGQLRGFTSSINTGEITLTTGGKADLSGAQVFTQTFNLAEAGNNLTLNDAGFVSYVVNGAGGNDKVTITGGNFFATVSGGGGDDILTGGGGNDVLFGESGLDKVYGGDGDDTLRIDAVTDIAAGEVYDGGDGNDTLNGNSVFDPADLSAVTIRAVENLAGFTDGVSLTAKQLGGFTGNISTGAITLTTGGNADLSGAQVFTQTFNLAEAGNNLTLTDEGLANYVVNGAGGNDKVTIAGGNLGAQVSGGGGDDLLIGGTSADTLDGGADNDILRGGGGSNNLTGGAGSDRFSFRPDETEDGTTQTITDFSGITAFGGGAGELDVLNFTSYGAGAYIDDAAFSGIFAGILEVRFAGENTLEVDTDGDGTSNFTIAMTGLETASQLVADDFLFGVVIA